MSDEEIKLDLQQQRFEKAIAKELENTAYIIKKTGVFNQIDKLYGDIEVLKLKKVKKVDYQEGKKAHHHHQWGRRATTTSDGYGGRQELNQQQKVIDRKRFTLILENKGINLPNIEEMNKKLMKR